MDADYLKGRICAVWTQACRFAEALGLTPRSINSAERELEHAGFIIRNAGINGGARRRPAGWHHRWAAGINLAPLIARYSELKGRAEALDPQARAISQCRAEIRQLGQRIRHAFDQTLRERAEAILPGGRTARITSIARLTAIRETPAAMLDAIVSAPAPDPRAPKTPTRRKKTAHPIYKIKTHHEAVARGTAPTGSRPPLPSAWPHRPIRAEHLGGATWPNIVEASWRSCARLGIAQTTWGRACQHFGRNAQRSAFCLSTATQNCPATIATKPDPPAAACRG
jgi:hypothetical protein